MLEFLPLLVVAYLLLAIGVVVGLAVRLGEESRMERALLGAPRPMRPGDEPGRTGP